MNATKSKDAGLLKVERPTTTLKELALDKMRNAILGFHFQPGERLVERRLAEMLGVSRTVVREVLRHLETEGLVETFAYQGPVVARLNAETVDQIYELRAVIEVMATRACAGRIGKRDLERLTETLAAIEAGFEDRDMVRVLEETTHFYAIIFTSADKTVAWQVFRNLNARINQLRAVTLSSEGRSKSGPLELRRILDAIRDHDPDAAERACREHVERAHEIARRQLQATEADAG
ncbi:MAG: GntR family transcriptional regulator [Arenicellales bacterium]